MGKSTGYVQLFLRLALGIGFIYPVLDRIGWLGVKGQSNVSWGNWKDFLDYVHVLLPFLSRPISDFMGLVATMAELGFGILLSVGFKTRIAALGSFILLLAFGLSMAIFTGLKAPFNYSVFSASAGAWLLTGVNSYPWSVDHLSAKDEKIFK